MLRVLILVYLSGGVLLAQSADAVAALRKGDFPAAEKVLRAEIVAHPKDAMALSLLGAALDSQKKFAEADGFHRRAVAQVPTSVDVLNNCAAHLWMWGKRKEAGGIYQRVIALDPSQQNANLQLARLSVDEGRGGDALRYLDRLPPAMQELPQIQLLRLPALYLAGQTAAGDALGARVLEIARPDAGLAYAAGVALSSARQFSQAERFFESALKSRSADFNTLYSLGLAADLAGDYERASEVLEAALRQSPDNVDALYTLARVREAQHQSEAAVELLANAGRLDPQRADVQKTMALTMTELGAFRDAVAAWNRYLKLKPGDDTARRERASVVARMGSVQEGIAGLEQFLSRHPNDAVGWYQLADAERNVDGARALTHLNRALSIDPANVLALGTRGDLYYHAGNPEKALNDLERASALQPNDPGRLDRLGQVYQALDRTDDAVRVLRSAAKLSPTDSKIVLHLGQALAQKGDTEESRQLMERFRELGPEKAIIVPEGFASYVSLPPEQRRSEYRARLAKAIQEHPADVSVRLAELRSALEDADFVHAATIAKVIMGLKPGFPDLAAAGHALVQAKQYEASRELLKMARTMGSSPEVDLDLALATGSVADISAIAESVPGRADLTKEAVAFLAEAGQFSAALAIVQHSADALPDDRSILLLKADTLELAGRNGEADAVFEAIRARWPEWYQGWVARGIVLLSRKSFEDAADALKTAVQLDPKNTSGLASLDLARNKRELPPGAVAKLLADPTFQ